VFFYSPVAVLDADGGFLDWGRTTHIPSMPGSGINPFSSPAHPTGRLRTDPIPGAVLIFTTTAAFFRFSEKGDI